MKEDEKAKQLQLLLKYVHTPMGNHDKMKDYAIAQHQTKSWL